LVKKRLGGGRLKKRPESLPKKINHKKLLQPPAKTASQLEPNAASLSPSAEKRNFVSPQRERFNDKTGEKGGER